MPTLPIIGPTPLDGGELPVRSRADVLAVLPVTVRTISVAPVRDALVDAMTELFREYQRRSRQAAAQADQLRATSPYIDGIAADHEVYKQLGEDAEALRARLLAAPDQVSPNAIIDAVNIILAPFTTKRAKYFESEADCWFVNDGTGAWDSFVYTEAAQAAPHYPDRLYADDAAENSSVSLANREVLGALVFADNVGRYFVLRIPPLEAVDDDGSYAFSDNTVADGMFVADGSDTAGSESDGSVTSFVFTDQVQSDELYAAIVNTVELLKGQGIRWQAYVDPLL